LLILARNECVAWPYPTILKTYDQQFTLTTKISLHTIFKAEVQVD